MPLKNAGPFEYALTAYVSLSTESDDDRELPFVELQNHRILEGRELVEKIQLSCDKDIYKLVSLAGLTENLSDTFMSVFTAGMHFQQEHGHKLGRKGQKKTLKPKMRR